MRKRILYTVLDWGLGHATRSIPVIRALLASGCEVVIASDSMALEFLKSEFPHLPAYKLSSYNVQYTSDRLWINVARNWRKVFSAIRKEHEDIENLILKERITAIVSDNRYGCYHSDLPSVIITHQLKFRTGRAPVDNMTARLVEQWLKPFDRIWVPDDLDRSLSGELSESSDPRVRCIGWQSTVTSSEAKPRFKVAAIISGPEPQRTNLEKEVRPQLESLEVPCIMVRGTRGFDEPRQQRNLMVYDFMGRQDIDRLLSQTEVIVCRTGYSSLMDLKSAGKKAILIPTPAQPEQLYLGEHLKRDPFYVVQQQGETDLCAALSILSKIQTPDAVQSKGLLLQEALMDFFALVETHDDV